MGYIETLIANCETARVAKPAQEFVLGNLDELNEIDQAIYIIEEIDGNPDQTFIEFSNFKSCKSHACARLNAPSRTLYVGSSSTGVKKRISEHLGDGHKSTYALHMKHWFQGKYQIKVLVYDQPLGVLQIIEDALAYELRPAFGKPGGNNR